MGCTWPFSITFITQNNCFSSLCFCHWQFVPPLSMPCPLWSLFHCSSWPFVYRMNKGQRLKMSSQLGLCSSTDLTSLLLKMSSSSKSDQGRVSGSSESRNPQKMVQKQCGRGCKCFLSSKFKSWICSGACIPPTWYLVVICIVWKSNRKKNTRLAYSWQGWEGKQGDRKTPSAAAGWAVCIYISQAKLFSGLFTHNVLGAAKMPVAFYLDFVAMHISHKILGRVCKWDTNLVHLEKHVSHCEKGERFRKQRHNKGWNALVMTRHQNTTQGLESNDQVTIQQLMLQGSHIPV